MFINYSVSVVSWIRATGVISNLMEGSGYIKCRRFGAGSKFGSGLESGSGLGFPNETETTVTTPEHPYLLALLLVQLMGSAAVIVPAVVVIATIISRRLLSKSHYGFVVCLMICDIITVLPFSLFHSALYLYSYFTSTKATVSCYLLSFFYIAPVASGFMVVNLTIDAALAMTYPLKYRKWMTRTKVIALSILAWILAAFLTLPSLASSSLDEEVEDLHICPPTVTPFLPLLVGRFTTAVLVIVLSAYLYWSAYKTKKKIKCLTRRNSNNQSLIVKLQKNTRLSITLLLIVTVDCILRIARPVMSIVVGYVGFYETPAFLVVLAGTSWVEFINHPVVYGLMLHDVYHSLCCKSGNAGTPV